MKKGINKEVILKESEKMIKSRGVEAFSLRALSARLGIKPASLYNHVSGIDEIYFLLAEKTAQDMKDTLEKAIGTKPPDEAFVSGANAYRSFMENNRQMYLLFIKARPCGGLFYYLIFGALGVGNAHEQRYFPAGKRTAAG